VDVNSITQVISQVGFPIFVAVWLLWKGDQQNKQIVDALNELKIAVTILAEKVGAGGENGGK
jgi:hypothetical protein